MNNDKLNEVIRERLGKCGIFEYTIDGMKLNESNYSVNEHGVLEYDKVLDVFVRPKLSPRKIKLNIVLKNE